MRKENIKKLTKEYNNIKKINPKNPILVLLKSEIVKLKNKLTFINSVRDRYFDKEGFLNPNKKRVKEIIKKYSQKREPKRKIYVKPKNIKKLKIKTPKIKIK